jgi:hypothetical protein
MGPGEPWQDHLLHCEGDNGRWVFPICEALRLHHHSAAQFWMDHTVNAGHAAGVEFLADDEAADHIVGFYAGHGVNAPPPSARRAHRKGLPCE